MEQRILEAYAGAGSTAVVTGWASLRLQGGGHFDGYARDGRTLRPVPIAVDCGRVRPTAERDVVRHAIPPDEVVVIGGIRCAKPERALFDEMRLLVTPREMAVAAGSAYAAKLTSRKRMLLYCQTRRWFRDKRNVAQGVEQSIEGCRSPQEDRFRQLWEYDADWGRPIVNRELRDQDGVLLGIPDLFDPVRLVVGEYAGAEHRLVGQHETDIGREAAFRRVGLEYVEVVARDLRNKPKVIARMREAEERAGRLPQLWVLGPPPSPTLDEILDARDAGRCIE